MSGDLVLLTGATGLVGFGVLEELLKHNYKVRVAVRSHSKIEILKAALRRSKYASAIDGLEFLVVSDMAATGAFDEAVTGGVQHIIHVAAPIPAAYTDYETQLIKPAIDVTLTMLHSALKQPTVETVVITSSVAAVMPAVPSGPFDADNVEPDPQGPYKHPFMAYAASKKLAFNATRRFIADENPKFDVVNVMPAFVIGPNGCAVTKEEYASGSNQNALAPLLGQQVPEPRPRFSCHVEDVAVVHVAALKPEISGHQNFGVSYDWEEGTDWNTVIDIVKKRLPDLVEKGVFPLGGSLQSMDLPFDASKTEKVLNIKFKTLEDMVVDLARDYARVALSDTS